MGDLDRPNIGYDALRTTGNYWLMHTLGNYNIIYADVGRYRRYYAQSTIDRMIVYGYWLSYDDVVAWVNSTMPRAPPVVPVTPPYVELPPANGDGGNGDGKVPNVNVVAFVGAVAILVGVGYGLYRLLKGKKKGRG